MSKLEELTRKMQELEANGDVTEEELGTYKALLEAAKLLGSALPLVDAYRRVALGDGDFTAYNIRCVLEKLK